MLCNAQYLIGAVSTQRSNGRDVDRLQMQAINTPQVDTAEARAPPRSFTYCVNHRVVCIELFTSNAWHCMCWW